MKIGSELFHGRQISNNNWEGSQPCRFKGGKSMQNQPVDQLDNLLQGGCTALFQDNGKRHYSPPSNFSSNQYKLLQQRFYPQAYKKSTIFEIEEVKKLIKIDRHKSQHQHSFNRGGPSLMKTNVVGQSKMKQMQTGNKKTGIYRNFYKSQIRSAMGVGGQAALTYI